MSKEKNGGKRRKNGRGMRTEKKDGGGMGKEKNG